jgi:hypothetical protein
MCRSPFTCLPLYLERGQGEFCSRSCSAQFRWMGRKPRQAKPPRESRRFKCLACGNDCLPKRIHCSKACRDSRRVPSAHVQVTCAHCGKPFQERPCVVKRGQGRYCSRSCFAADVVTSGHLASRGFSAGKGGKRSDLDNRYFRSRWEANYARYLNWMIQRGELASWTYEPRTFEFPVRRGSKFYTPDFYLTFPDGRTEYHEVKGYMDQVSKTKLKRMGIHYPKETVVVIDHPIYKQIHKQLSSVIAGWETPGDKHSY